MITTVIFDLFGTLLKLSSDSKPYLTLARRGTRTDTRNALQLSLVNDCSNLTDYANLIGLSPQKDIDDLKAGLIEDIKSAKLFDDTLPVLKTLREKGIKTALISNLAMPYKQVIADNKLDKYFDFLIYSCDCGLAKPDPLIYQLALDTLNSKAKETVMIGDSFKSDFEGSARIGIKSLLLVREKDMSPDLKSVVSLDAVLDLI